MAMNLDISFVGYWQISLPSASPSLPNQITVHLLSDCVFAAAEVKRLA
jgi:hypothetical protein